MASLTGPSRTTQHDGLVTLEVPTSGPYGMTLAPGHQGKSAVIKAWDRLPSGKFGPVQIHGGIRLGDYVLRVNDTDLTTMAFKEVKAAVTDSNVISKVITFGSTNKYKEILQHKMGGKGSGGGGRDFVSAVRQARINKDGREPFAEFEVVCKLKLATTKVHKESSLKWSVWHRFSDFLKLHTKLAAELGWQMKEVKFPKKNSLTLNKLNITFVETRRNLLDEYWQQVIAIDRITDFGKHHANEALAEFLDVNHTMATNQAIGGTDVIRPGDDEAGSSGAAAGSRKPRVVNRRGSLTSQRNKRASTTVRQSTSGGTQPLSLETAQTETAPVTQTQTSTATEIPEEYERYFKMLKMHLPRAAVEQKMRAEGVDPSVLDQYGDSGGDPAPAAPPPPTAPKPVSKAEAPPPAPKGKPAKATGGRVNLLADIAKRRID